MFYGETRRVNRDGSVVSYLQLAHNERHPVSGNPVAKVIHSFGRADKVDRAALARLRHVDLAVPDPGTGRDRGERAVAVSNHSTAPAHVVQRSRSDCIRQLEHRIGWRST